MRTDQPEEFRHVDLSRPATWYLAPIDCWVRTRERICSDVVSSEDCGRVDSAHKIALQKLRKQERNSRLDILRLSARQRASYLKLFFAQFSKNSLIRKSWSPWTSEFMRASQWVPHVQRYRQDDGVVGTTIDLLFEMCRQKDRMMLALAQQRIYARAPGAETRRDSRRPRTSRLPDPIELIQIFRMTYLMIVAMRRGLATARAHRLRVDKHGGVFPCPKCGARMEYVFTANAHCGHPYPDDESQELRRAMPLESPVQRRLLDSYFALLWRFGYAPFIEPGRAVSWPSWSDLLGLPPAKFSQAFLGYIFDVSPDTVRRRLARGPLSASYHQRKVPRASRVYLDRKQLGAAAHLRPRGWSLDAGARDVGADDDLLIISDWSIINEYSGPVGPVIGARGPE